MSIASALGPRRRLRPGWKLLLVGFVILPLAAVFSGDWLIFHVFGNGHHIAITSPGFHLILWWDHLGREIVVALLVSAVMLARRVFPPVAIMLGLLAGVATVAWWFVVILVALALAPPGTLS